MQEQLLRHSTAQPSKLLFLTNTGSSGVFMACKIAEWSPLPHLRDCSLAHTLEGQVLRGRKQAIEALARRHAA
jgi:hypothetical protein